MSRGMCSCVQIIDRQWHRPGCVNYWTFRRVRDGVVDGHESMSERTNVGCASSWWVLRVGRMEDAELRTTMAEDRMRVICKMSERHRKGKRCEVLIIYIIQSGVIV